MVIVMQNSKLVKTNWKKLFIIAEQYEEVKEKSYKVAPSIHCRKAATWPRMGIRTVNIFATQKNEPDYFINKGAYMHYLNKIAKDEIHKLKII